VDGVQLPEQALSSDIEVIVSPEGILKYIQFKKLVKSEEASPFCSDLIPERIHLSDPLGAVLVHHLLEPSLAPHF
jgi:hypothetical protein